MRGTPAEHNPFKFLIASGHAGEIFPVYDAEHAYDIIDSYGGARGDVAKWRAWMWIKQELIYREILVDDMEHARPG